MIDPVDQPHFDRRLYRDPNPLVMSELRRLADTWRAGVRAIVEMRKALDDYIVLAYDAGHSYSQIREQTGFGNGTLQMILAKAGRLKDARH